MDMESILSPQRTRHALQSTSKKRLLEDIAHLIHDSIPGLGVDAMFTNFTAREKLGSTALGCGIAIPHCRLANCEQITGALVHLTIPVNFDAVDGQAIDTVFALVVPEQAAQEHLDVLAALAALFSQAEFCQAMRTVGSNRELYDIAVKFSR